MNIVKEFNVIKNKIFVGTVVSSNKFIDSKLKANLKKRFPDSLCCDMESSATAQIATKNNIPFIIIRTIADNSFETLQNLMANNYKFDSQKYANSSAILSLNIVNKL
jgi:adenosylhomocysteine nucleosidase